MSCEVHTFPFPGEPDREAVVLIYEVHGTKFASYHKHVKVDGGSKRLPDSFTDEDVRFLCKCRNQVVSQLQSQGIPVDGFSPILA